MPTATAGEPSGSAADTAAAGGGGAAAGEGGGTSACAFLALRDALIKEVDDVRRVVDETRQQADSLQAQVETLQQTTQQGSASPTSAASALTPQGDEASGSQRPPAKSRKKRRQSCTTFPPAGTQPVTLNLTRRRSSEPIGIAFGDRAFSSSLWSGGGDADSAGGGSLPRVPSLDAVLLQGGTPCAAMSSQPFPVRRPSECNSKTSTGSHSSNLLPPPFLDAIPHFKSWHSPLDEQASFNDYYPVAQTDEAEQSEQPPGAADASAGPSKPLQLRLPPLNMTSQRVPSLNSVNNLFAALPQRRQSMTSGVSVSSIGKTLSMQTPSQAGASQASIWGATSGASSPKSMRSAESSNESELYDPADRSIPALHSVAPLNRLPTLLSLPSSIMSAALESNEAAVASGDRSAASKGRSGAWRCFNVIPKMQSAAIAAGQSPAGDSVAGISIFDLQREVANAVSEEAASKPNTASWGGTGAPLRALRLYLQLLGIVSCSGPALRSLSSSGCLGRLLPMLFMVLWQAVMWARFVFVSMATFIPNFLTNQSLEVASPSFFAAVRCLLQLAASLAHLQCVFFFQGCTLPVLLGVATRWAFVYSWHRQVMRTAVALVVFGGMLSAICMGLGLQKDLRGATAAEASSSRSGGKEVVRLLEEAAGDALAWLPLMTLYLVLAVTIQFCSLGLDAFALDLLNAPGASSGLHGLVGQFNVLSSSIRRAAYAVQSALALLAALTLALCIATLVRVALPALPADVQTTGPGDLAAVAWAVALLLLGLWLLNSIAVVNLKCKRLPALVHSLDFGVEIDRDRWCVAAHVASCEAGFPVHSVLVTRGAVLKLGYVSLSGLCLVATRLAVSYRS
eukprot:TRINITY_DN32580_c0_g1_i1.p1 TRINITY_DN32580_c0_g1~~TRINITY_DN32580_c0_g1_i1.p1  ORF type:complete len:852 (+),score=181.94 TRINITY_DN32580_c0_g1_i1:170-2725(+)